MRIASIRLIRAAAIPVQCLPGDSVSRTSLQTGHNDLVRRRYPLNRRLACALVLMGLALTAHAHVAPQADTGRAGHVNPNVLWHLVHDGCVPAARKHEYPPKPCVEVSAPTGHFERGYAVLKDIRGRYQYLVLPLVRITGIGSPAVLQPDAPNYLADAWIVRLYVEAALHKTVPRDELSLAVNSKYGRTQNELHVHVDCIRIDVHDILHKLLPDITGRWKPLSTRLRGHVYLAKWVGGESLAVNPFRALAEALPPGTEMGRYGLAVVGVYSAAGKPGFILLATSADVAEGNYGSAEELQDHSCAIAQRARH